MYKNFYMISKDTIPKMMDEFTESQTFVLGESWEKKDESKDIEIIGLFKRNENCIFISRKKTLEMFTKRRKYSLKNTRCCILNGWKKI